VTGTVCTELALGWLRIGVFGFGGGPSVIPLVRQECVERYHWMTDEQFLDTLALGNALPGPIAVKLAAQIGFHAGGAVGCAVALLALNGPAIAMMLALGVAWSRYRDAPAIAGALRGVRPVVVAMLAYTVWALAPDGVRDLRAGALAVGAFVALLADVHPVIVIAAGFVVGAFLMR
jgi:chromate transporter